MLTKQLSLQAVPAAFSSIAFFVIVIWIISGPVFKFSDTWQLVINTSTTIVTFLMVFLIQRSQIKNHWLFNLSLNELVASSREASNRLIDVEDLSQSELELLHSYYVKLAQGQKRSQPQGNTFDRRRRINGLFIFI